MNGRTWQAFQADQGQGDDIFTQFGPEIGFDLGGETPGHCSAARSGGPGGCGSSGATVAAGGTAARPCPVGGRELDQHRLHRHPGPVATSPVLGEQGSSRKLRVVVVPSGKMMTSRAPSCRAWRALRIISSGASLPDVAGQPGGRAEQQVVHQRGLHDAHRIGQAGDDHHRVEQGRVVGGDDQRPGIAQAVEFLQVEAAGAEDFEEAQVEARKPVMKPRPIGCAQRCGSRAGGAGRRAASRDRSAPANRAR